VVTPTLTAAAPIAGTAAASMDVVETAKGQIAVYGDLSFATVPAALQKSLRLLTRASETTIDLGGVERADSAGLALLLEWIRLARRQNIQLRYRNIPSQIATLARVSGLDSQLPT
jgi:phospholipid transport system transporter-binding protein